MPYGFSCKEISQALNVGIGRTSDAIRPTMLKMARLFLYDPEKAMKGIVQAMDEVKQEHFEEHELPRLERMSTGRSDREVVHPARSR